jgi:hypothetical protein
MLTVQIESDPYVGMLLLGRVHSGILKLGDTLWALDPEGNKVGEGKVKKIFGRRGLERVERGVAGAGEMVSVAGVKTRSGAGVNLTLVHPEGWGDEGPRALPVCFHFFSSLVGRQSHEERTDHTHRPTDHLRLRTRQRLPTRRTRRHQTHIPTHPRAYIQRSRNQRRFDRLTRSYVRISRAPREGSPPPWCPPRNVA